MKKLVSLRAAVLEAKHYSSLLVRFERQPWILLGPHRILLSCTGTMRRLDPQGYRDAPFLVQDQAALQEAQREFDDLALARLQTGGPSVRAIRDSEL